MISLSRRILDQKSVNDGDAMDLGEAIDLGIYTSFGLVVRVDRAGDGETPALVFKHAVINETNAYVAFDTPVAIDLTVATTTWFHVSAFSRFLAWSLSGTLGSEVIVTVDLIAKG